MAAHTDLVLPLPDGTDVVDPALRVGRLRKDYGPTQAVVDLSFAVGRGEFFGLLGPNGAGKTTTIRMVLGLIQPTAGEIVVLGERMSHALQKRIGYLPEERGLYQDVPVVDGLVYLAGLKGVPRTEARRRALEGLERLDLGAVAGKPVRALSRGMQQKAQFLATVLHRPELLIIDEPFAGLDPVNSRALRDMLIDLRARGTTVIMSAHQMHRVEELCDRLLVLKAGRPVLYGSLAEIRQLFSADSIFLEVDGDVADIPGVRSVIHHANSLELELAPGVLPRSVFEALAGRGDLTVKRFDVHAPSLEEIFLMVAGGAPTARNGATNGVASSRSLGPVTAGDASRPPEARDQRERRAP